MFNLELLELLPLAEEFEMKDKRRELKSPERQVWEYVQKLESHNDFRPKSDIEIEFKNGFVTLEYSVKSGTVFVDRFIEDEEINLSIEQKTHLKYLFVDAMERHYRDLIDWDEINRDYYLEEKIDRKLYKN